MYERHKSLARYTSITEEIYKNVAFCFKYFCFKCIFIYF